MTKILGRYDAAALQQLFEDAGVLSALAEKGFRDFDVVVDEAGSGLPHTQLFAHKRGERFLLLEGCITESTVRPEYFRARGFDVADPMRLALLYWLREQDPTATFTSQRPPLPLQRHPGLGILRPAFRVITEMAHSCRLDGVACVPKFFHDAVIFYRSRLFLFLDPQEQGRFEALMRDAGSLPLTAAFHQLSARAVRDARGAVVAWDAGLQVFPISASLTTYFHSDSYAEQVEAACDACHFIWATNDAPERIAAASPG